MTASVFSLGPRHSYHSSRKHLTLVAKQTILAREDFKSLLPFATDFRGPLHDRTHGVVAVAVLIPLSARVCLQRRRLWSENAAALRLSSCWSSLPSLPFSSACWCPPYRKSARR